MTVSPIQIKFADGHYDISVSVKRSDVQIEDFEGTGETLAEALFDLGDMLQAANV